MARSKSGPGDKVPEYTPKKLRLVRRWDLGLTLEALAEKMGCEPRTVQRYEKGDSQIPPDVIQTVEELRVEERRMRARELGEDEVDYSTVSIPGLELIELIPKLHIRSWMGKLVRMFVAVPKEWLPPSAEGEQPPPPPPPPEAGGAPPGSSTSPALPVTRAEFRIAMGGLALLGVVAIGGLVWLRGELRTPVRSPRGARVARDAKVERPVPSPDQKTPDETEEQEPDRVPGQVYTEKAPEGGDTGGAKRKSPFKLPKKAYSWQKVVPCDPGESEKVGGCWLWLRDFHPPCPRYAVEDEQQQCLMPIPADPKPTKPNTVEPEK